MLCNINVLSGTARARARGYPRARRWIKTRLTRSGFSSLRGECAPFHAPLTPLPYIPGIVSSTMLKSVIIGE